MTKSKSPRSGVKSPVKWHGGKHYLVGKVLPLLPPVGSYEVFASHYCGGAQIEMQRPQLGTREYLNDKNREVTNFWFVLSKPALFKRFERQMAFAPLGEEMFETAMQYQPDIAKLGDVEAAVQFFVKCRQSRQGLMKDYCTPTSRFRREINENVSAWLGSVDRLADVANRLITMEVWNRPALSSISALDSNVTLHYLDPPYLHYTRQSTTEYGSFEMTETQHTMLLKALSKVKGKFLLHGYPSPLYNSYALKNGWRREVIEVPNSASSSKVKALKKECVWMNY